MDQFVVRLVISFLIGGSWVSAITWGTIKYGAKVGGLLAGVPSTAAFSLVFIGWTQSTRVAIDATTALPLAFASTALFPIVYAFLAKRIRSGFSLLTAIGFWGASTLALVAVVLTVGLEFWVAVACFYIITVPAYYFLGKREKQNSPTYVVRPTAFQSAWRFALAGGVVGGAVLLSATVGPLEGGFLSSFPAIITSTMYLISRIQGVEAARSMAAPVMLATMFTIVPYVVVVRYSFPAVGIFTGTVLGYAVAIPISLTASYIVGRVTAR